MAQVTRQHPTATTPPQKAVFIRSCIRLDRHGKPHNIKGYKMKDLTQQEINFLNKIETTKTYLRKSDLTSGNTYFVTIQYNNKRIAFHYNDNIHNESNKNDFIWALLMDSNAYEFSCGLTGFMTEFDYDDETKARKIYNACKKQYNRLHKLFNANEIEMFEQIYQNY